MHTALYRANSLVTVVSTSAAVLCALASVTDLLRSQSPTAQASVQSVLGLQREHGFERAYVSMDIEADLSSLFSWNTKQAFMYVVAEWESSAHKVNQVVLWNEIAGSADEARISLKDVQLGYPYALTEYGGGLKGLPYNLTLAWETVPYAGLQFKGRTAPAVHTFPAKRIARADSAWGRNWI